VHSLYSSLKSAVRRQRLQTNGVPEMITEMALAADREVTTDIQLWRVVIARTIHDWLSKPLGPKREAERYLFQDSADLSWVCESAGIKVAHLRTCLNRVRGRALHDLLPIAA